MIDWQERLARQSPPGIDVEHEIRYRLAAPLIVDSATWCDLGCGNGVAGAAVLAGAAPPRVVLVDRDEAPARAAAAELGGAAIALAADLTSADDLARVRDVLLDGPAGPRVVTAFEVIERLSTFLPLVEALTALEDVDVVLSVPNDAFWAINDPEHRTMWGEGAFEELRRLLPAGTLVLRQVALAGSVVVPLDASGAGRAELDTHLAADGGAAVPTHMIAAFGPRVARLAATAGVRPVDLDGQRQWEREREAAAAMVETLLSRRRAADELPPRTA
jgi:hypothetical protein